MTAPRLSSATMADAHAVLPRYDRATVTPGIVHLGLGAFHRAHQAVYTDDILAAEPRWGICGVSLKTPRCLLYTSDAADDAWLEGGSGDHRQRVEPVLRRQRPRNVVVAQ